MRYFKPEGKMTSKELYQRVEELTIDKLCMEHFVYLGHSYNGLKITLQMRRGGTIDDVYVRNSNEIPPVSIISCLGGIEALSRLLETNFVEVNSEGKEIELEGVVI